MKKLFLLTSLTLVSVFATNILNFKVYERSDRIDIMFTFDTPFDGRITQKKGESTTTLTLYDAIYPSQTTKVIDSPYISSFTMQPLSDRTLVEINLKKNAQFAVSKTLDSYGLRLRFNEAKSTLPTRKEPTTLKPISQTKLQTQTDSPAISTRYMVVVGILLFAVIALYIIKRRVEKNGSLQNKSWLFKNAVKTPEEFEILFQKPLDQHNRVVMLSIAKRQYLAIVGNTNVLLDKFSDDAAITQEGFETVLKQNQQELDRYMQLEDDTDPSDPLQAYKEKASLDVYRSQMEH